MPHLLPSAPQPQTAAQTKAPKEADPNPEQSIDVDENPEPGKDGDKKAEPAKERAKIRKTKIHLLP